MKRLFVWIYLGVLMVFFSIPAKAQYSGDAWLQILGTKEVKDAMGRQSVYLGVTNTIEPGSIFIRNKVTV